ncbi:MULTISPECIES: ShlB/FhaC/HecB family hemolysin secretion/activation protein [unclassified Gilliamella]|uniref:ShlB/FhaC/HecB family hemolysin secretion/activation protein n=1 Tax=unclassified Gilliamella TaxID=2685620 RepID=UPI00132A7AA3|nr:MULTISPECIES: ShlB/FhaC/HecB family hemolysin secretion/activation protein [unclassified Gilliamella]MWN31676.1 ShlB/FhaC/HecB family hemolysin secretion/activation protein [Gilliamella sp. Pra-s60]MWP28783.1 ShlB/FhaC/HecB family hemolysin secretion/activation protein [Gilliamella sp. Pra-s54]
MKKYLLGLTLIIFPVSNLLAEPQTQTLSDQQLIHQQERQKALEETLTPTSPDIRLLPATTSTSEIDFPIESLCFNIHRVELVGRDQLPWYIPLKKFVQQGEGHCLGGQGINLLMSKLQDRLVSYGFITTRVVAPEQDLGDGTLKLLLVEGKVRHINYSDDSDKYAQLYSAIPVREGKTLNLRDIEQGLENLQRLPTVSAQMHLVPGDKPGESDIVISRKQSKMWRIGLSVDDSGTKTTGRDQGGATIYLDNLLSLSDSFYASGGHDLNGKGKYGSRNYLLSYSVPWGYWLFNASLSGNKYHQTVAGQNYDYKYSGRSRNENIQLSRVIHRNESQKTTLSYGISLRQSHNYIDDTEIEIQQRKTTHWQLGLQHRHYINDMTFDAGLTYQKGVRWFNAKKAPEEHNPEDNGSALSNIFLVNFSANVPFRLGEQQLRYRFDYQGQYTRGEHLTSPDQFSIGGRWSVRGFDGELTLKADRGWYVRNELAWQAPFNHEPYLGIDTGEVSGAKSEYLLGRHLTGGVMGVRGNNYGFYYDLFAGTPIRKPKGFKTNPLVLGFSVNWNY